jgi:3-hydroxy acid dehydrogenase / malonic semialdehyde reductase
MTSTAKPRALVTGATSGIGKAISFALCDAGYKVIALGRSQANLAGMSAKNGIQPLALDLTDREALATAIEGETIDVLVNNAGIMPPVGSFADMAQSDIDTTLEVNLSAALATTRLVLPSMIARGQGHVFFTGSTAGHAPFPNMAVYGASKAAIASFAAGLRCDLSGSGVRVTEIVAGRVETALYRDALTEDARTEMYSVFQAVQPQDVAHMLTTVLAMPPHVDVTRFDILPTAQFVGGGGIATEDQK